MKEETIVTMKYVDPICGMTVAPATAAGSLEHQGETVYFCSKGCLEKYKKQIDRAQPQMAQISRIKPTDAELEAVATETAIDPICGMTVNKATAAARFEHDGETHYFCCPNCLKQFQKKISGAPPSDFVQISVNKSSQKQNVEKQFVDPICGMSVAPETAAGEFFYKDKNYYFCSEGCLNKFKQNPANFLERKKEEKLEAASEGTEYTCPMHPEVLQNGPGSCPFCGMALEPKTFRSTTLPTRNSLI